MKVIKTLDQWDPIWIEARSSNQQISLVPTMGALHEGHLELVRCAQDESDLTIVSIFVNPTQFNNLKDFETYPKTTEADLALLEAEGVDAVFLPEVHTMYPQLAEINLDFGSLENVLEGKFRPGHFSGVGIVVSKLFNIIRPQKAFFGQKDLQQVAVIKRLVDDLSFPIELKIVPTKREKDGLALSSRNLRLRASQRQTALILIRSLRKAKNALTAGQQWPEVQKEIEEDFAHQADTRLEYFELVEPHSFQLFKSFDPDQKSSLCVAASVGEVRLIDNLTVNS